MPFGLRYGEFRRRKYKILVYYINFDRANDWNIYFSQIKDGKIDAAAIKASMAKAPGGGEKGPFNEVIEGCQSITNSDRCELASQFDECMHKGFAAHHGAKKN